MMKECEIAPDMPTFRRSFAILMRWQELHAMCEDGVPGCKGFFAVVNERFENLAHQKGLLTAHGELHKQEQELVALANNPQSTLDEVKPVFAQWVAANETHLKNEEDVMMPCVKKMMEGKVNLVELLQFDIMPCIWDRPDFGFFVQHAASTLEKYPDNNPRARVFLHALHALCTPQRWHRYLPYVKAGLSPRLFHAINTEVGIEQAPMPLWAKPDPDPVPTEKAKPMIFAIMRNGHEVIRGMMKDVLISPDVQVFRERYAIFVKWQELHALCEEGGNGGRGLFQIIDEKFEGKASNAGLQAAHGRLHPLEEQLERACEDPRQTLASLQGMFRQLMEANEQHLKDEETIMMPAVSGMAQSGVNLKQMLQEDIVRTIWDRPDFGFFVQAAASTLEKYPEGMPRARVFVHAIKMMLPPERYAKVLPYIRAGLSPSRFTIINAEADLDPSAPASFQG